MSGADAAMRAFRDATVDKWNGKVALAGAGGGRLKALGQSVLAQTQQAMQARAGGGVVRFVTESQRQR